MNKEDLIDALETEMDRLRNKIEHTTNEKKRWTLEFDIAKKDLQETEELYNNVNTLGE